MTDAHGALIYTMVLAAASNGDMTDREIHTLGEMVNFLPVFRTFDHDRLPRLTRETVDLMRDEDGLDKALDAIETALPEHLRETAYAIACDVIAVDGQASQEELRLLEMLRDHLDIDRLHAAAIERGARVRNRTL
ncbi:MAG TPA: tellurite resistance TerB family protein [Alphaproteobacteria bacterium]|nr:tellurite resistance TerB family protein [Alphaproteobacteria bacterium]